MISPQKTAYSRNNWLHAKIVITKSNENMQNVYRLMSAWTEKNITDCDSNRYMIGMEPDGCWVINQHILPSLESERHQVHTVLLSTIPIWILCSSLGTRRPLKHLYLLCEKFSWLYTKLWLTVSIAGYCNAQFSSLYTTLYKLCIYVDKH